MSNQTSGIQTLPEQVTEAELEAMHLRLLERRQNGDDASTELLDEARQLITRGRELGRLVDDPRVRLDCQSVLNYWAIYLYRSRQEQIDAHLQPYDPLTAPELTCECPYRFGGEQPTPLESASGWRRLIDQAVQHLIQAGLVTVVGSAGSGRRLFVDRVLLPRLKRGGDEQSRIPAESAHWRYLDLLLADQPFRRLIAAVRGKPSSSSPGTAQDTWRRIPPEGVPALVDETGLRTVLVIRDLEQALKLPQADGEPFLRALYVIIKESQIPHAVIATLRREGIVRLSRLQELEVPFRQTQLPLAFTSAELRSFVEEPAARVGLVFDPGVVDRIVNDLQGEPTALPLLQFTMRRLWDRRRRNRITRDAYDKAGAGRVALEMEADAVSRDLAGDTPALRDALRCMVQFEVGGVVSVQAVSRTTLREAVGNAEALDRVLARLEASDLIEGESADGDTLYRIKHYALLTSWPQLIEWLDEWRFRHRLHLQLSQAAQQWGESGRCAGLLWSGTALAEALEQLNMAALPEQERDFLEQSRRIERTARLRRKVAIGTGVAFLLALLLLLWLNEKRRALLAEVKANAESAERVKAESDRNSANFARWSSMLPDVQERLQRDDSTATLLLLRERRHVAEGIKDPAGKAADQLRLGRQADDWRRGIALSQSPRLNWLWLPPKSAGGASGASTAGEVVFRAIHPYLESDATSSPQDSGAADDASPALLILQGDLQETRPSKLWRWRPATDSQPALLSLGQPDGGELPRLADAAVLTVDGRNFVLGAAPAEASGLFVAPLDARREFEWTFASAAPRDGVRRVFAGRDGRFATLSHPLDRRYGELRLWQLVPAGQAWRVEPLEILRGQPIDAGSLAEVLSRVKLATFSPSGRWLLTVHNEPGRNEWDEQSRDEFRLWDLENGRAVEPSDMQSRPVQNWRPAFGDDVPAWMHDDLIRAAAFAPATDGAPSGSAAREPESRLVTASASGKVEFWSILEGERDESALIEPQFSPPLFHEGDVYDVAFDDRGRYLITGSRDRTVRIWHDASRREAVPPLVHEGTVTRVAVAGGQLLASTDDALRSWHVDRFAHRLTEQPSGHPSLRIRNAHDTVNVAREGTGATSFPIYRQLVTSGRRIEHVALDDGGRFLLVAASRSQLSQKQAKDACEMIVLDALTLSPAAGASWAPVGNRPTTAAFGRAAPAGPVVALTEGNRISLWRFAEQAEPQTLSDLPAEFRDQASIHSLAFSPDGMALAVAGSKKVGTNQHIGRIWLVPTSGDGLPNETADLGTCWTDADTFPQRVRFVTFSADAAHAYLITGEEYNRAQVFQTRPRLQCKFPSFEHTSDVIAAALRPEQNGAFRLATVSSDGEVRLWEVPSAAKGDLQPKAILAHGGKVDRALFSPDGELVVTAGQDGAIRLWHFASGELVGVFRLGSPVSDMRFVDQRVLLTVGRRESSQTTDDSLSLRLWSIRPDQEDFEGERGKNRLELLASRQLDESGAIIRPLQPQELRERAEAAQGDTLRNDFGAIYRFRRQ